MSDNVTNELLLEHLKAIQANLGHVANDVTDVKTDMRGIKEHMAAFMRSEVSQDSGIAQLTLRVERIEKRLSLSD
ncbi:hypothetical protein [Paracoccus methylarcula]|nr:hypothetical protein [Paracoccus methylarcula]